MWLRSSSRTESRMPSREAAQLKASGLGSHVAVKRAGMEGREAYWSAAARDCGKAREKITDVRKTKGVPAGHHGGKHLSGLDGCQWIPCASAVRCARAAIEPTHVGHGERRSAHAEPRRRGALFTEALSTRHRSVNGLLISGVSAPHVPENFTTLVT